MPGNLEISWLHDILGSLQSWDVEYNLKSSEINGYQLKCSNFFTLANAYLETMIY